MARIGVNQASITRFRSAKSRVAREAISGEIRNEKELGYQNLISKNSFTDLPLRWLFH